MHNKTDHFFQALTSHEDFQSISNYQHFQPLPDDWLIVIADVRGSTAAVENGQYKEVNMIGASAIIALLNIDRDCLIPFVFGGDGSTLLVPPSFEAQCRSQLPGLITLAKQAFNLTLCAALIPVSVVRDKGFDVRLLKFKASDNYYQAMILGGGITYAETLAKQEQAGQPYRLTAAHNSDEVNLQGLECRWQDIHPPQGEVVSLLIQVLSPDTENSLTLYQKLLSDIQTCYQNQAFSPIQSQQLQFSYQRDQLNHEAKLTSKSASEAWWKVWQLRCVNFLGQCLIYINPTWRPYKKQTVESSDHKKFDDMLRMVISGTSEQRQQLESKLAQYHASGDIVYGLHTSDRALMTCLVMDRFGQQVHFLDGADGGYTRASTQLKRQLSELNK